jgi:hypothetical protein
MASAAHHQTSERRSCQGPAPLAVLPPRPWPARASSMPVARAGSWHPETDLQGLKSPSGDGYCVWHLHWPRRQARSASRRRTQMLTTVLVARRRTPQPFEWSALSLVPPKVVAVVAPEVIPPCPAGGRPGNIGLDRPLRSVLGPHGTAPNRARSRMRRPGKPPRYQRSVAFITTANARSPYNTLLPGHIRRRARPLSPSHPSTEGQHGELPSPRAPTSTDTPT